MFWNKKDPSILIVEDELHNHDLYQKAFSEAGFTVTIRPSADGDFIEEVAALSPDIISMDLMIGGPVSRDGFAAITLLKADSRTKRIPVFVLTNFFQEDKVQTAKDLGATDYINVQGQPLPKIAALYKQYLDNPKRYQPSNPLF
ncbi:response regulator [Candidatus Pacebacteria bacterium]|nr:response regulator [Candidatus Paceibacterota bacterium]